MHAGLYVGEVMEHFRCPEDGGNGDPLMALDVARASCRWSGDPANWLARMIHDGSSPFDKAQGPEHSRGTKSRSRVARRARGAVRARGILKQYVEGANGEPAGRRFVAAANPRWQQKRS